ncbi:uncharacterized protein LOC133172298 [Saccostrea echinata]|uniref:uncharacterized protein LOC133172298 n=1 Tax=Saccostrea echinata TaxID=191078 RepID=UPI002A81B013|nr:uncharacterized protein LOC133172298 [Saccostrea echinata]
MPQTLNKRIVLENKLMPCGKGSARNALWKLDFETRRRAMKLNEQQEQRLSLLCKILDRQKNYNEAKANRAMEELVERGVELEKECKIRRLLVERNLTDSETNRAAVERLARRRPKNILPSIQKNISENNDDHVWISRMPGKTRSEDHKNRNVTFDINSKSKETQASFQRLADPSEQIFEVSLETGATQRWHVPVQSLFSRFTANLRSSHYSKTVRWERET